MLLNVGDALFFHDPAGRTLASHRREAVSLPDDAAEARDFTTFGCEACLQAVGGGGRCPDVAGPSGGKAESD